MRKLILTALATVLMATNAFALSVNVLYDNSPSGNTGPLSGYATTGAMMDAMSVRAYYDDGVGGEYYRDATWNGIGIGGAATHTEFSLSESGDTFGGSWTLTNLSSSSLTKLFIDAGAGNSVFDVISNPNLSPGSARGWGFTVALASPDLAITATYSGAVSVDNTYYGDIYRYLTLEFDGGFGSRSSLAFISDTDNVKDLLGVTNLQVLSNAPEVVPEPSTLLLLGGGLVGLLVYRRKRMA